MSLDRPRALLLAALTRDPLPTRLELHALLYRVVARCVIGIRNCLREPAWQQWAADLDMQISLLMQEPAWATKLAEKIRWIPERETDRLLVFSATVLQALDRFHRERHQEVMATQAKLPDELGGGRTLFLTPPQCPIEDLIPANRRLGRGTGDLENDPRAVLDLWWHLVPLEHEAVQPEIGRLDLSVSQELGLRLQSGDLRIGVASPFADLDYVIWPDSDRCHAVRGTPYRFVGMVPEGLAEAREILETMLATCARERIDLLCFPELTLDTSLLGHLSLLLKTKNTTLHPLLIVAGSFHMDAGLGRANRCSILDGFGDLVVSQDKCTSYGIPGEQARRMHPDLLKKLGIDERGGYEDISTSASLQITETALGRLATPICLDFCGTQLRDLLVQARVNLLFVPAMTPRMGPFYSRARELGTQSRTTTFVANSAWLLKQIGLRSRRQRALAYVPARKGLRGGGQLLSDHLALFTIRELLGLT